MATNFFRIIFDLSINQKRKYMSTVQLIEDAIKKVIKGYPSVYINSNGKVIRVSDHGANPSRVDDNTVSLVVNNSNQSYQSDRGRVITSWERYNQWYIDEEGNFCEQFDSIDSFLSWFDIN